MAVRLVNLHSRPLRIDLRGGDVLILAAGQRSDVLHEELLYDNVHVDEWVRAGWLMRQPARLTPDPADEQPKSDEAAAPVDAPADAASAPAGGKKKPEGARTAPRTSSERN
jgi:hypothetical protein